jgi:hypothetical protein
MKAFLIRTLTISICFLSVVAFASPIPQLAPPGPRKGKSIVRIDRKETRDAGSAEDITPRPFIAMPNTAGWGNWRLCNDAAEDVEPAIIRAQRSNPQGNPIDTTMVAYMKRFANGKYRLNALFTDGDPYVPNPGPLPLPAPYTTSADPIVAATRRRRTRRDGAA